MIHARGGHLKKVCMCLSTGTHLNKRRTSYDLLFVTRRELSLRMDFVLGDSGISEHEIL